MLCCSLDLQVGREGIDLKDLSLITEPQWFGAAEYC